MAVDEAERTEKRLKNLEDIASRDPSYKKTISYQSTKAKLEKSKSSSSSSVSSKATISSEKVYTPFGTFKVGNTPFEQIQSGTGEIGRKVAQSKERLAITQRYNPEGLSAAMAGGREAYPEAYKKASEEAVNRRIEEQNVGMFVRSGLGDLLQAGLITHKADVTGYDAQGKPTYGDPYLVLSDKGRNLGKENIYSLEDKATWGSSFDFYFGDDDAVYIFPEGTRKATREAGFDFPVYLRAGEEDYLVLQKEGSDTIKVAGSDAMTNRLTSASERPLKDFLDLEGYEVSDSATFKYFLKKDGEFDIEAMGVSPKGGLGYSMYVPIPVGEMRSEAVFADEKLKWVDTPLTGFYQDQAAERLAAPFREYERSIGAEIPVPFIGGSEIAGIKIPEKLGVISTFPYMVASGTETIVKSGVAFGDLLLKSGTAYASGGKLSDKQRSVWGSELLASSGYLMQAPITAVFVSAGLLSGRGQSAAKLSDGSRLKLQSVRMEPGGEMVKEYNLYTQTIFKPSLGDKMTYLKSSFKPSLPSLGSIADDAVSGAKSMYFLAGSEKLALRQIAAGGGKTALFASVTAAGLNPMRFIKPASPATAPSVRIQEQVSPKMSSELSPALASIYKNDTQFLKGNSVRQATLTRQKSPALPRYIPATVGLAGLKVKIPDANVQNARLEGIQADLAMEAGRTKSEQVAAIRERAKLGFNWRYSQRVAAIPRVGTMTGIGTATRITDVPRPGLGEVPRFGTGLKVGTLTRQRVKVPEQPRIFIPKIDFAFKQAAGASRKAPGKSIGKQFGYAPSLAGIGLGYKERSGKGTYLGHEIRGIIVSRKKKRRRK